MTRATDSPSASLIPTAQPQVSTIGGIIYTDDMTGINWSKIPVTIVEMGFMTHETDDRQMADPAFQETMAAGIADGIDAYFGLAQ